MIVLSSLDKAIAQLSMEIKLDQLNFCSCIVRKRYEIAGVLKNGRLT